MCFRADDPTQHDEHEETDEVDTMYSKSDEPRYQITSVMPFGMFDTVIMFRAQRIGAGRFAKCVQIAVDHRPARALREALAQGLRPMVQPESWQVLG